LPRIRTIKPEFFKHEGLAELPHHTRLAFIALLTLADCEGRLEDRPRRIKTDVLPYDDIDMNQVLEQLAGGNFLRRYSVQDLRVIEITGFKKHQRISGKEAETPSQYPPPPREATGKQWGSTGEAVEKTLSVPEKPSGHNEKAVEKIPSFSNVQERKGKEKEEERREEREVEMEAEGKVDQGMEGETEKSTPVSIDLDSEEVPEGLDPAQYARGLLEKMGLPTSRPLLDIVRSSIETLARSDRISPAKATAKILDRARMAKRRGEEVNRFWFEDGRFNSDLAPPDRRGVKSRSLDGPKPPDYYKGGEQIPDWMKEAARYDE